MKFPLVRDLAAEGFPVRLTCGTLGFVHRPSTSGSPNPSAATGLDDAHLVNVIRDLHQDDPPFGYRFLADELKLPGHRIGERRVQRLCREHQLWSTTTKKGNKVAGKPPGPPVPDDLVRRDFSAPAPDRLSG